MRSIAGNFIWLSGYQLVAALSPVLTAPYLARILGPSGIGEYSYVTTVGAVVSTLSLIGTYGFGNRETAYQRDDATAVATMMLALMSLRVGLGLAGCVAFLALGWHSTLPAEWFWIYVAWLVGVMLDVSWVLVGLECFKPAVLKNIAARLLSVIGIFAVVKSPDDVGSYLALTGIVTLMSNLSVYHEVIRLVFPASVRATVGGSHRLKPTSADLARCAKGSCLLFVPQIPTLAYQYAGRILIIAMGSTTDELALFDQGEKIVAIPLALLTALSTVAMPRMASSFAKGDLGALRALLVRSVQVNCLVAIPAAIGLAVVGRGFVEWFLGPNFALAGVVVVILSPLLVTSSMGAIASFQYFTAVNLLRVIALVSSVAAITNIGLNALLIPSYGAIGCAMAALVAGAFSGITLSLVMFSHARIWEAVGVIMRYLSFGAVMGLVTWLVGLALPNGILAIIAQIGVGCLTYLALLVAFRDQGLSALKAGLWLRFGGAK